MSLKDGSEDELDLEQSLFEDEANDSTSNWKPIDHVIHDTLELDTLESNSEKEKTEVGPKDMDIATDSEDDPPSPGPKEPSQSPPKDDERKINPSKLIQKREHEKKEVTKNNTVTERPVSKEDQDLEKTEKSESEKEIDDDEIDDELDMDALRKAALQSLGSRSREVGRKDSAGSRSRSPSEGSENEGDDDLENMRRKLLADRAKRTPGDLRSKLSTKPEKFHLNPAPFQASPQKPLFTNLQFTVTNQKTRPLTVVKSVSRSKPEAINVGGGFKITRTVKNDNATNPNDIIIDPRDSSDEEEVEEDQKTFSSIHRSRKRRKSSRAVFQTASDIVVDDRSDDSLEEISSESEPEEITVIRKPTRSKIQKAQQKTSRRSPTPERKSRSSRSRRSRDRDRSRSRERKPTRVRKTGNKDLDEKFERIRRENERLEKRAKLIEYEKRKYGYK